MGRTIKCTAIAISAGVFGLLFSGGRLEAQAGPAFVNGDVLITVPSSAPDATVQNIAAGVQGQIAYRFGPIDKNRQVACYHVRLPGNASAAATQAAITQLKQDNRVLGAFPNRIYQKLQATSVTPNDPRFSDQWGLPMIRMPQAWSIEKGSATTVVAVIDTGIDISHEDLSSPRIFEPFDAVDGDTNPSPTVAGDDHGTHVSGIATALTDNGKGGSGVVFSACRFMPIRASTGTSFTAADLLRAWQHLIDTKRKNPSLKFVVNGSYGGADSTDFPPENSLGPTETIVLTAADEGIVCVFGAGNSAGSGNPPFSPANLATLRENILCVAAVGETGLRSAYSSFRPTTTIAAPGGDATVGRMILSTTPGNTYGFLEGTSMAAPHVTGAVALLLSVDGVQPNDIKGVLTSTARRVPGSPVPSPEYGHGIIDVYEALLKVGVSVTILEPEGTGGKASSNPTASIQPTETLRPVIRVKVSLVQPSQLVLRLDGIADTSWTIVDPDPASLVDDGSGNMVPTRYTAVIDFAAQQRDLSPGQHRIDVVGTRPGFPTATDFRFFNVTPFQIASGRSLISIPFFEESNQAGLPLVPEDYFGQNFRLARFNPVTQQYAFYSPFDRNSEASFKPSGIGVKTDGGNIVLNPVGLAYFGDVETTTPILTRGTPVKTTVVIPLKGRGPGSTAPISWNMVGDPFPFNVPFNALLVDSGQGRMTIAEAASKGLLLPVVYSYDGASGYTFRTLPDGALEAWKGHWIGVLSERDINLVVPPAKLSRSRATSAASASRASVKDGWLLQLTASSGQHFADANNFIGVSKGALDSYDMRDIPEPPALDGTVSASIENADWGGRAGVYAQDIRGTAGQKTWNVVVRSGRPNEEVTLRWAPVGSSLPRNVKLTIKDMTSGQAYDMRSRTHASFQSGEDGATRRFLITASTSVGGAMRISNLAVRSTGGRASSAAAIDFNLSSDATYEVKILSATGAAVGTVASRSAGAGDVHLVWTGRDSAGRNVPAGAYLVQVRAVASDGEVVKVIRPFSLVR